MIYQYHCTRHQTRAICDPETRRVSLTGSPLTHRAPILHDSCDLARVASQAFTDPDAIVGPHGPPQGRACPIVRDA